jgi:hypothetical protein
MMMKCRCQVLGIALFLLLFCHLPARANVYATDIRINGSLDAGVIVPGGQITISYILNDDASAGVTLRIFSGANIIHTVAPGGGSAGTQAGLNSVVWGGTNDNGATVAPGVYTVSISAASQGYDNWTAITDDGNTNFSAIGLTGIDVNRNTNSPYYGRVFVGCAEPLFTIMKRNADGSPADEGGSSNGGLSWGDGTGVNSFFSPWKIAVGPNDKVYINDFSGYGVVYAFDDLISTNYQVALQATNYPYSDPELSGLYITGSATNGQIWMTDENAMSAQNTNGSAGILRWQLGADGTVATNGTGIDTVIAPVTNASPLAWAPYDIAIGADGSIYTIQQVTPINLGIIPIVCFPPYDGVAETSASWVVGAGDTNLVFDYGIAVNPSDTLVAVAVRGIGDSESGRTGFLNLYDAATGEFLANLDQTGGDLYVDVAWDNVGNLYALDLSTNEWRVYSPPGSNQSTTVSVPFIQAYSALTPPSLSNPNLGAFGLNFTLQGQSNVTYVIEQSPDLMNWTPVATNFSASTSAPISIPFADNQDFYRAATSP